MSELRLAGNAIAETGHTGGHLQIVYVTDENEQREIEVTGPTKQGTWNYSGNPVVRDHTAYENTREFIPKNAEDYGLLYKYTEMLEGPQADSAWEILKGAHAEFTVKGAGIPYDPLALLAPNSNSYVTTLLKIVGIDINQYLPDATPTTVNLAGFPGAGWDIPIVVDFANFDLSV